MSDSVQLFDDFTLVEFEVIFYEEDGYYIAYSPALDLAGQGSDFVEAETQLKENVHITIDWALEHETLNQFLLEKGWAVRSKPTLSFGPPPKLSRAEIGKMISKSHFKSKQIPIFA